MSYDWIADLQSRPQNASIRFVNLGVGGDPAYSALKRLPQVIQCRPDKVVVLIGAGRCNMHDIRDTGARFQNLETPSTEALAQMV